MLVCEECRLRNNWVRKNQVETGDCEWCWTRNGQVGEITSFIKDKIPEVAFELRRIVQDERNNDFKTMAEGLVVFHTGGPRHGSVNNELTEQLHQIEVKINGATDWEATFLRRARAKDSILKIETFNRN